MNKIILYLFLSSIITYGYMKGINLSVALGIVAICGAIIVSSITDKYFEIKQKVLSENDFRKKVNDDIAALHHKLNTMDFFSNNKNPFKRQQ